jgi:hypothetical protein
MKVKKNYYTYSAPAVRSYPYPNAAEPGYFAEKVLDGLTALITGIGAITVMIFLITM